MRPGTTTIGYKDASGVILAAGSYSGGEYANIELLYKRPGAPRGLGRLALGAILHALCRKEACEGVLLSVRLENEHMLRLCFPLGFAAMERPQGKAQLLYLRGRQCIRHAAEALDPQRLP